MSKSNKGPVSGSVTAIGARDDTKPHGLHVLVVGGVHGNEPCGAHAVERIGFEIASGGLPVRPNHALTVVRANDVALAQGKRFVQYDLNRLQHKERPAHVDAQSYENRRAQDIMRLIDDADVVLDLHATSAPTEPHLIVDRECAETFADIGIGKMLTGWSDVAGSITCGTVESYARLGGKLAATLECGWNQDPASTGVAYAAAHALLRKLGVTDDPSQGWHEPIPTEVYEIDRMYVKKSRDFFWRIKDVRGFRELREGEVFAAEDGDDLVGRAGEYLLMPSAEPLCVATGKELFFIGRRVR